MIIDKQSIAQKIDKIKSVVPSKTPMACLQGILYKNGYLIASNSEMTVKANLEAQEGEALIIPMKAFDLIKNLPDGDIEITTDDKFAITIRATGIKNKFQSFDPDTFMMMQSNIEENAGMSIDSSKFMDAVGKVMYSISSINSNLIMSSLCLESVTGILNMVGLDGHRISWNRMDYDRDFKILVPKSAMEKLISLDIKGNLNISYDNHSAIFTTEDYEVHTRLVAGDYYKYEKLFDELPSSTVVSRKELLDALHRASICGDKNTVPVKISIEGTEMKISLGTSTSEYYETVTLQKKIETDITIGFNPRLVIECLKSFACENVALQLSGPKAPMIIESEDSDLKALVLPVALKS